MNNEKLETYLIAKTWKRIIARSIDIISVSVIPLLITTVWYNINKDQIQQWWVVVILIVINLLLNIIYFVVIPWKFNGQTLGKKICFIKLVAKNQNILTLKNIIYRELFLVFIPVILTMLTIFITYIFLGTNISKINLNTTSGFWINIFIRKLMFSFIFAWYLGIIIVTKVDKKHQLFYDRKYQLYIVNSKAIVKKIHPHDKFKDPLIHVHLGTNQPGNIDTQELTKIQEL